MDENQTFSKLPTRALHGVSPQEYVPDRQIRPLEHPTSQIRNQEYPPYLRCPQFDAVFFFHDEDSKTAYRVIDLIKKFVRIYYEGEPSRPPDICTMDNRGQLSWVNSSFQRLEEAFKRTTYILFLMTRNYDKDSEEFQKLRDEAMFEVLYADEKYEALVPLHTYAFSGKQRYNAYPVAIRTPIGVDIRKLFEYAESSSSIDDARLEDVDQITIQSLQRIFDDRLKLRKNREKAHNERVTEWTADELTRRRILSEQPQESVEEREERMRVLFVAQPKRSGHVMSPSADGTTKINIEIPQSQFSTLRIATDSSSKDVDTSYKYVDNGLLPRQPTSQSDETQSEQPQLDPSGSSESPYWLTSPNWKF